jgi:hypothetical protein
VVEELSRGLRLLPQLRLGQLIGNVLPERCCGDPYYIPDDEIATKITQFIHQYVPCEIAKPGLCHFGKDHQGDCGRFVPAPRARSASPSPAPTPKAAPCELCHGRKFNGLYPCTRCMGTGEAESRGPSPEGPTTDTPKGDGVECVNCARVVLAFTSSKPAGENAPAQRALRRDWPELANACSKTVEHFRNASASPSPSAAPEADKEPTLCECKHPKSKHIIASSLDGVWEPCTAEGCRCSDFRVGAAPEKAPQETTNV